MYIRIHTITCNVHFFFQTEKQAGKGGAGGTGCGGALGGGTVNFEKKKKKKEGNIRD